MMVDVYEAKQNGFNISELCVVIERALMGLNGCTGKEAEWLIGSLCDARDECEMMDD